MNRGFDSVLFEVDKITLNCHYTVIIANYITVIANLYEPQQTLKNYLFYFSKNIN